jgi:Mg-chelatase subunit ChlD
MAHEVFISYASAQEAIARQVAEKCKADGVRCWMAPDDIVSGTVWVDAIMDAIKSSQLLLVLLTADAINSPHVDREVYQAVEARIPILPVRIEDLPLSPRMKFWLGETHWFDAFNRPPARRYDELTANIKKLLSGMTVHSAPAASSGVQPAPLAPATRPAKAGKTAKAGKRAKATKTVDLQSLQAKGDPKAEPPAEHVGHYGARMDSQRPGCFILLVDQSGSMNKRFAGTTIPKRQSVADAVNILLYQAVLRATAENGVRHRYDIGVLGYGIGEEGVQSAFGTDLAPIDEIATMPKPPQARVVYQPDGRGGVVEREIELPIWLEPAAKGKTLMYEAFQRALEAAREWTSQHKDSFPPIIINITDGGFTKNDPTPLVFEIQELTTEAGNALVFNCHISEEQREVVMYPGPSRAENFEKRMRQLYEMSSVLPEPMRKRALEKGYNAEEGARGYVFNADAASLYDFLEIGGTRAMEI